MMFCRLLVSLVLLVLATATNQVAASEEAPSISESGAKCEWSKARKEGDGPGRSTAVEAFGRVCCHGDESLFLEAIGLAQEQGEITFLLRDAIAHELKSGNTDTLRVVETGLRHNDPAVRRKVADALFIGPAAEDLVPALARALTDEDAGVRIRIARAVGTIGPAAEEAIPALVEELVRDRGSILTLPMEAREEAASALGMIGEAAVPSLMGLLDHESRFVRWQALKALSSSRPDEGISLLWDLLKQQESRDPYVACRNEERVRLLAGVGSDVAYDLAWKIYEVDGPVSPTEVTQSSELLLEVVGMLVWAMQHDLHAETRYAAVDGIGSIGVEFRDDMAMWDDRYHEALFEVLDSVGKAAVPALLTVLSDDAPHVRRRSIMALGELGPAAAAAVRRLQEALEDEHPAVRQAAAQALQTIKGLEPLR